MKNPYYFSRKYEHQYEIILDRHHPNHLNNRKTIKTRYNLTVELSDLNNIFKEMAIVVPLVITRKRTQFSKSISLLY